MFDVNQSKTCITLEEQSERRNKRGYLIRSGVCGRTMQQPHI